MGSAQVYKTIYIFNHRPDCDRITTLCDIATLTSTESHHSWEERSQSPPIDLRLVSHDGINKLREQNTKSQTFSQVVVTYTLFFYPFPLPYIPIPSTLLHRRFRVLVPYDLPCLIVHATDFFH